MRKLKSMVLAASMFVLPALASAQNILIINGSSGTSEPGTTSSITTNLRTLHEAVGNTVTVVDGVPASFSGFSQIWDIRFSNVFALTGGQQSQYLSYLQGGGRVFMMGENSGFASRNSSIFSLINAAGGGSLAFANCGSSSQTVSAPFTGPNAVSSVSFNAPGCFNGTGTGQWITNNGSTGTGLAWTTGALANATAGTLTSILDVNFMQNNQTINEQNLTRNLIGFVNNPPPVGVVPEPSTYLLMATGLAGVVGISRRRRTGVR
ncbi:MAG TPA: PEP-CTERM sorting domain-containing protein [Gemmatimonadaceae bacterium]|nr:PEP-CTERM sorting domain-containing protein [Gemmatimonadaceae bacterium]